MKKKIFSILLIASMMLSGCTSVIELTAEQENLVAEYAAGLVIKAYKESEGIIPVLEEEEVTEPQYQTTTKPQESQTGASQGMTQPGDQNGTKVPPESSGDITITTPTEDAGFVQDSGITLMEVLNVEGVELSMMGYSVEDKYPLDDFAFVVEATAGHKLLVVEYDVWNSVDANSVMKLDAKNAVIKAVINGSDKVSVYKTMLKDDLLNMNDLEFAPGEAVTGVLIFQITDEMAANITSVDVTATTK